MIVKRQSLKILCLSMLICIASSAKADEGMWMIHNIDSVLMQKMEKCGLNLPANVIYDESAVSISDAVVALDFGCTGSMISDQGLLITNHHCAYSDIYALSTPEHDYLEDGFWAMKMNEEIPIKGKSIFFLRKVIDVTDEYRALKESEGACHRGTGSRRLSHIIEKKYNKETGLEASLSGMWRGTKHYMYLYEVYKDVRLVGAPPVSIGAFGGDIDNWEWPQHKGDFALYRIYTAPDGSPAEYSPENVPMHPRRTLTISKKGLKEGDFTMVIGFPGRTNRYCSSFGVDKAMNISNPILVDIQGKNMDIMRHWMNKSPEYRLAYANQFFSTSNVQELYEGEMNTLRDYNVKDIRIAEEKELKEWIKKDPKRIRRWGTLLEDMKKTYDATNKLEQEKIYMKETLVKGSKYYMFAIRINNVISSAEKKKMETLDFNSDAICRHSLKDIHKFYRETRPDVERAMMKSSTKAFAKKVEHCYCGDYINKLNLCNDERIDFVVDSLIDNSFLKDSVTFSKFIAEPRTIAELKNDPLVKFYTSSSVMDINKDITDICECTCRENYSEGKRYGKGKIGMMSSSSIINLEKEYTRAIYEMRKEKGEIQYPDANSTMRITYGNVSPLILGPDESRGWYSKMSEILEKYNPDQYEYVLKPEYRKLLKKQARKNDMTIDFLTNNDITGGNSGSPVLNADGEIVGLAFDGNKESLCGNIYFHPELNKCVNVDIRYVLWILDEYAHFDRILEEINVK